MAEPSATAGAERTRGSEPMVPPTDIYETEAGLVLLIDLPGVARDGVDVNLEQRVLTIRAQAQPDAPSDFSLAHGEFRLGEYERSFTVSEAIDRDRIIAALKHGVLKVVLPKAQPASARKISVTAD
jgi:HSP20 family molecular chaperone IbpA